MNKIFSWAFIGLVITITIFFSGIVSLITDWWWFSEVGFTEVFTKSLLAKMSLGLTVGVFAAVFLLTNFLFAIRSKIPWMLTIPEALIGRHLSLNDRIAKKLGIGICVAISFFIGLVAAASWQDVLKFLASTPFGQTDPLFGKDVAFYVFSLPVYSFALSLF